MLKTFYVFGSIPLYSAGSQHRPASVVCGDEQGDLFYSAGQHGKPRVLAKVLCSLQPKVGCFGEAGVVLAPAEIGVFWRRCRCATPIQSWRCCGEGVVAVLTPSQGGGGRSVLAKVVWLRSTQWGI